jgi:hypothetical protein
VKFLQKNNISKILTDFLATYKWQNNFSYNFTTLTNLLCVSVCTQIKEEKQYDIEREAEYEKQTEGKKRERVGQRVE